MDEPVREPLDQPVREPVADPAAPGKCDALYDEYVHAREKADRLWKLALFMSWATAVLIVVAVMMVFLDFLNTQTAAGGVALLSGIAAGAIVTNAVNASKAATEGPRQVRQGVPQLCVPTGGARRVTRGSQPVRP